MYEKELGIIENNIAEFKRRVISDIELSKKKDYVLDFSQYPIFFTTEENFFSQEDMIKQIEKNVSLLLKKLLNQLFFFYKKDCYFDFFPIDNKKDFINNVALFNSTDVKLILNTGKKIGIIFTPCPAITNDQYDKNLWRLSEYGVDDIIYLSFNHSHNNALDTIKTPNEECPYFYKFGDFLDLHFGKELSSIIIKKISDAVSMIIHDYLFYYSITKINNYSSSIISNQIIQQSIKNIKYEYNPKSKYNKGFCSCDFLNNNKIKSVLSKKSDYYDCLFTSEYLFTIIKNDYNGFDYTSIVMGYFKSIEIFLFNVVSKKITKYIREFGPVKLYYKLYKNKPYSSIFSLKDNDICYEERKNDGYEIIPYRKTELNWLKTFLIYNKLFWLEGFIKGDICICLNDYIQFCRNEHSHKDLIFDFEDVKRIRNNTYFLLSALISSLDL